MVNSKTRDKEILTIQVNNKEVEINHNWDKSSGRSFKLQGLDEITSYIHDEIVNENKEEGHIAYNNFESSCDWKILKAKPIQLELPFPENL
jgi:hypothetical protein